MNMAVTNEQIEQARKAMLTTHADLENILAISCAANGKYNELVQKANAEESDNLSAIPGIAEAIGNLNAGLVNVNGRLASLEEFSHVLFADTNAKLDGIMAAMAQPAPSLPYKPKTTKPFYLRGFYQNMPADLTQYGFSPLKWEDDDRRMFKGWNQPGFVQPGPDVDWDRATVAKMCAEHRSWGREGICVAIEHRPDKGWDLTNPKTIDRLAMLHHLIRANGMKSGHYGGIVEAEQSYWGPVNHYFYPTNPQTYTKWVEDSVQMGPVTSVVDMLCPSLYDPYDIFERWIHFSYGQFDILGQMNPTALFYPFVSPRVAANRSKPLCTSFVQELEWLVNHPRVGGIMIWDGESTDVQWDENWDWIQYVKGMAA
jgi:hypothetical protein